VLSLLNATEMVAAASFYEVRVSLSEIKGSHFEFPNTLF
jgi:hypothetical protein